uniref:Secreted protein n=1 Tax=Schistosoma mansoni TaxID=6183 RepID=A0A5K4F9Z8_SCHMA
MWPYVCVCVCVHVYVCESLPKPDLLTLGTSVCVRVYVTKFLFPIKQVVRLKKKKRKTGRQYNHDSCVRNEIGH